MSPQGQALRVAAPALTAHRGPQYTDSAGRKNVALLYRMTITRTVYYALHAKPDQPYPLHSGTPFTSLERTRLEARKLAQQGYCGWILRLRETREDHWPDDRWLVDHSVDDTIGWVEQF